MKKSALLLLTAPLASLQAAKINPAHIPVKPSGYVIVMHSKATLGKHVMKEANEKDFRR